MKPNLVTQLTFESKGVFWEMGFVWISPDLEILRSAMREGPHPSQHWSLSPYQPHPQTLCYS